MRARAVERYSPYSSGEGTVLFVWDWTGRYTALAYGVIGVA